MRIGRRLPPCIFASISPRVSVLFTFRRDPKGREASREPQIRSARGTFWRCRRLRRESHTEVHTGSEVACRPFGTAVQTFSASAVFHARRARTLSVRRGVPPAARLSSSTSLGSYAIAVSGILAATWKQFR
jgi:hypothetical protein